MTIIQNLACIELNVNPDDHHISFSYDAIKDKKITGIFLFAGDFDTEMYSPYRPGVLIDVIGPIGVEDYFLNLTDVNGNQFVKNFSFNNNIVSISDHDFDEININRILDIYKSNIVYNINAITGTRTMLLLVFYQTRNFAKFDDVVNGSFTVTMPVTNSTQDICLKDVIPTELKNRRIKQIIPYCQNDSPGSYLDLVTKEGTHIQNLPVTVLQILGTKAFYFDHVEIDVNKSYFRQRAAYTYQPKLTFIY